MNELSVNAMTRVKLTTVAIATSLFLQAHLTHAQAPAPTPPPPAGTCQIWRDSLGIPHARGAERLDAYRCLGYLHGLDRAFQMDYFRRTAQGKLSEVLGTRTIKLDFQMRLIGLAERAAKLYQEMDPTTRAIFIAYADGAREGMNAAIKAGVYEFKDLDYQPEPWLPEHSVAIALLQSFDQTRRSFEEKLRESKREASWGAEAERLFSFEGREGDSPLPWYTTILKPEEYPRRQPQENAPVKNTEKSAANFDLQEFPELPTGSNNWALSPRRSTSGRAWFANDPHLALKTPSFWHWSHVQDAEGKELDVIGAAVPGMPIIASGANRFVSWGLTNSYLDVADLYEVPESALESGATRKVRPVVWFRLWKGLKLPVFFKTFQVTGEGWPVLPIPAAPPGTAIVLRWSGFDLKGSDLQGFHELATARDAKEADAALQAIGLPSWNVAYADTKGSIGFRSIGKIPRRGDDPRYGLTPLRTLSEAPKWDFLSAEEMPHVLNPRRGFVATANNRQWGADSRFAAGRIQNAGTRAFRIEELITARPRHDFETQRRIQCDVQAVDARFLVPKLLALASNWQLEPRESAALQLLKQWNFEADLECQACGVFRFWVEGIYEASGLNHDSLYRALSAQQATLPEVARKALGRALDTLGVHGVPGGHGVKESRSEFPTWAQVHTIDFPHVSGEARYANRPMPSPGDEHSVNPGTGTIDGKNFRQTSGASQRLIVELTQPPRIRMVLPSLLKDEPVKELAEKGSPWRKWRDCEYDSVEFPLDWSKVQAQSVKARWGNVEN